MYINAHNPKNEPPGIKTLNFRVKNSFDRRVGNTKEFVTSDFKMAAKNYCG